MAKVGHIFKAVGYDGFDTDRECMEQCGCLHYIGMDIREIFDTLANFRIKYYNL